MAHPLEPAMEIEMLPVALDSWRFADFDRAMTAQIVAAMTAPPITSILAASIDVSRDRFELPLPDWSGSVAVHRPSRIVHWDEVDRYPEPAQRLTIYWKRGTPRQIKVFEGDLCLAPGDRAYGRRGFYRARGRAKVRARSC